MNKNIYQILDQTKVYVKGIVVNLACYSINGRSLEITLTFPLTRCNTNILLRNCGMREQDCLQRVLSQLYLDILADQ